MRCPRKRVNSTTSPALTLFARLVWARWRKRGSSADPSRFMNAAICRRVTVPSGQYSVADVQPVVTPRLRIHSTAAQKGLDVSTSLNPAHGSARSGAGVRRRSQATRRAMRMVDSPLSRGSDGRRRPRAPRSLRRTGNVSRSRSRAEPPDLALPSPWSTSGAGTQCRAGAHGRRRGAPNRARQVDAAGDWAGVVACAARGDCGSGGQAPCVAPGPTPAGPTARTRRAPARGSARARPCAPPRRRRPAAPGARSGRSTRAPCPSSSRARR